MKSIFFTVGLIIILSSKAFSQMPSIDVTELTLKVGGAKEEIIYYAFADGDQIIFNFSEVNGKELKELEIVEYPSTSKFMDYKTSKIENKVINVNKKSVYKFRLYNSAITGRICKIKIQRVPRSEETKSFNSNVNWITKQDTTWNSYTKDIIVGYDTTFAQKNKKVLIKLDTVVVQLFDKSERVHSETAIGKTQYSYVNVYLPENSYIPNKFNPYKATEIISWSYWIGVGQKAQDDYAKANKNISNGISTIGSLTGYGALAQLAITGVSMFTPASTGDNVSYRFNAVQNGQQFTFDFGNGVSASGRNDKLLQGAFTIQLFNDNFKDGIDVGIKVIAVQLIKNWEDQQYTEQVVKPRYEKKIFTDPVISVTTVPVFE